MASKSSCTSCIHVLRGLPLPLLLSILLFSILIGILSSPIRCTCPSHPRRRDFIHRNMSCRCEMLFISLIARILQNSSSFSGPYMRRIIFLSNLLRFFISLADNTHVSDAYVSAGRISVLYRLAWKALFKAIILWEISLLILFSLLREAQR
jgi:hypothetical protein